MGFTLNLSSGQLFLPTNTSMKAEFSLPMSIAVIWVVFSNWSVTYVDFELFSSQIHFLFASFSKFAAGWVWKIQSEATECWMMVQHNKNVFLPCLRCYSSISTWISQLAFSSFFNKSEFHYFISCSSFIEKKENKTGTFRLTREIEFESRTKAI